MLRNEIDCASVDASRRTFLKGVAATGAIASAGSSVAAEDDDEETEEEAIPIVLGGKTEHWFGLSPEPIEGEENPTLQLQVDQEYKITWINMDGEPHELAVLDEDETELEVAGEELDPIGETQQLEFTATEEMAIYYCTVHPTTMVGDIEIGDGFDAEN